jgi:hypothetical protein
MASAILQTAPPRPPVRHVSHWNTPRILRAGRLSLLILDFVMLAAAWGVTSVHREAMKTVGKNAAPSIIAAQHIKAAIADMDAEAANELLDPPGAITESNDAYEARRIEAAKTLISAAENITYGEDERGPIAALQVGIGTYERLIQRARDLHERNDPKYVEAYRDAAKLLDATLLPAAETLDKANTEVLEHTYREQAGHSSSSQSLFVFCAVMLVMALGWMQLFLTKRMRRAINPQLLLATVVALFWLSSTLGAYAVERRQLKVAREDAFDSIHALWRARADAYWANSDESRSLLDPTHLADHERDFAGKIDAFAKAPAGMKLEELPQAERSGISVKGFTGYLADEFNNITFRGEREAAVLALTRFNDYLAVTREVRRLDSTGHHRDAIALGTGTESGQSDWAFDRLDQALGATIDINQTAFDNAVTNGFSALEGVDLKAAILAAIIGVLAFLGLAPRIREYQ